MRIISPLPRKRGRLEIIPLIDIMFFLLASFMMVSLEMQHLRSIKVSLPTATQAKSTAKPDMITLTVNRFGQVAMTGRGVDLPTAIGIMAWACWAIPLLMTEVVIQGRKIVKVRS